MSSPRLKEAGVFRFLVSAFVASLFLILTARAEEKAPLAAEKGRMPEKPPPDFWTLSKKKADGQTAEEDRKDGVILKKMYLHTQFSNGWIDELDGFVKQYEAIENPTPKQKNGLEGFRALKSREEKKLQMSLQKFADDLEFLRGLRAKRAKGVEPITEEEMNTLRELPKEYLTQGDLKLLGRSQGTSVPSADAGENRGDAKQVIPEAK